MHFPATGRRQYHAVTRGWVANEVFRRVHPLGLTIGEFLSANINTTLDARVFIGCDDPNYCPVKVDGPFLNLNVPDITLFLVHECSFHCWPKFYTQEIGKNHRPKLS